MKLLQKALLSLAMPKLCNSVKVSFFAQILLIRNLSTMKQFGMLNTEV